MSYMDVKPGKYLAQAVRARFAESQNKGTVYIEVEFKLKEVNENLRWQGFMTEKTKDKTFETMCLLDWNYDETFGEGSINLEKEVQVVVELQPPAQDGKEYPRIRWVNDPNAVGKFEGMDVSALKTKLGVDVRSEMAAARARLGQPRKKSPPNLAPGATNNEDTIPF